MIRSTSARSAFLSIRLVAPHRRFAKHIRDSKPWMTREDAMENKYFNEKDKAALRALMAKLDTHAGPKEQEYHAETLEEIFEHHGAELTAELKKDLVMWKTGVSE